MNHERSPVWHGALNAVAQIGSNPAREIILLCGIAKQLRSIAGDLATIEQAARKAGKPELAAELRQTREITDRAIAHILGTTDIPEGAA